MSVQEKFSAIRKGLLEFLILKIIASDKVYVADMLSGLSETEFETQEGTLYPLLSKLRREGLVDYEWQESDAGPPRKYYELTAKGTSQLAELNDYWKTSTRRSTSWDDSHAESHHDQPERQRVSAGREAAYGLLRTYLDAAELQLKDNPDEAEIISDLEQAIADKCNRVSRARKTVVDDRGSETDHRGDGPGRRDAGRARV